MFQQEQQVAQLHEDIKCGYTTCLLVCFFSTSLFLVCIIHLDGITFVVVIIIIIVAEVKFENNNTIWLENCANYSHLNIL